MKYLINILNYTLLNISTLHNYIQVPNYIDFVNIPLHNINPGNDFFDYEILDSNDLDDFDYVISEIYQDQEENELEYTIEDL